MKGKLLFNQENGQPFVAVEKDGLGADFYYDKNTLEITEADRWIDGMGMAEDDIPAAREYAEGILQQAREEGEKIVDAETWKGNNGQVEQLYTCPHCGLTERLSAMDEPLVGRVICGDDGFGGIENGCGRSYVVRAKDPYGRD